MNTFFPNHVTCRYSYEIYCFATPPSILTPSNAWPKQQTETTPLWGITTLTEPGKDLTISTFISRLIHLGW